MNAPHRPEPANPPLRPDIGRLSPLTRTVLLVFGLFVLGLLFQELVTLLVAILITVLIAIPLAAAATRLERLRVPRWLGALLALLVGVGAFAGVVALVVPPLVDEADTFIDQVPGIVADLEERIQEARNGDGEAGNEVQRFLQRFTDEPARLLGSLASLGVTIAGVIGAILLILITAYYIALQPRPLLDAGYSLFPPNRRPWARHVANRLRTAWLGWMQGVLVDMVVTGVLLYIGLRLIGLDFATLFAALSAVLVVVPYFGAIVGAIPPVVFALTISVETAILTLAIYVAVQQIESNVTIPLVMANRVKLHPAVVAVGIVVIGQLFGFIGLFVAVPLLSALIILVDELWVKPLADARGVETATEAELAGDAEVARPERPGEESRRARSG